MGESLSEDVNIKYNKDEGETSTGSNSDQVEDETDRVSTNTESSDSETPTYKLYSMSVSFQMPRKDAMERD